MLNLLQTVGGRELLPGCRKNLCVYPHLDRLSRELVSEQTAEGT